MDAAMYLYKVGLFLVAWVISLYPKCRGKTYGRWIMVWTRMAAWKTRGHHYETICRVSTFVEYLYERFYDMVYAIMCPKTASFWFRRCGKKYMVACKLKKSPKLKTRRCTDSTKCVGSVGTVEYCGDDEFGVLRCVIFKCVIFKVLFSRAHDRGIIQYIYTCINIYWVGRWSDQSWWEWDRWV